MKLCGYPVTDDHADMHQSCGKIINEERYLEYYICDTSSSDEDSGEIDISVSPCNMNMEDDNNMPSLNNGNVPC